MRPAVGAWVLLVATLSTGLGLFASAPAQSLPTSQIVTVPVEDLERCARGLRDLQAEVAKQPEPPSRLRWFAVGAAVAVAVILGGPIAVGQLQAH